MLIGRSVVADSVNSVSVTRNAWREVARSSGTDFIEIEITCSDKKEHQKRAETRAADLPITWQQILDRDYENWELRGISIDSSTHSIEQSVKMILDLLSERKSSA